LLKPDSIVPSGNFCALASRLARTDHENRLSSHLPKFGLCTNIPVSFVDVGLSETHPILAVSDFIKTLDADNKMDTLLMGSRAQQYEEFWNYWRQLEPGHPIFHVHHDHLGRCIPVAIHADEGTSVKKKALMVLQTQPLLGRGSRKRKADSMTHGLNFVGNSLQTRFLFSVMLGRMYSGKKHKNKPLLALVRHLSLQLRDLFYHGCRVRIDGKVQHIYVIALALKGDWPALSKLGRLSRHHGRNPKSKEKGAGICHLCRGGMVDGSDWHDTTYENMAAMHKDVPVPWTKESDLTLNIPMDPQSKAKFFRIDVFHTCHKGVMADLAANIIAPQLIILLPRFY